MTRTQSIASSVLGLLAITLAGCADEESAPAQSIKVAVVMDRAGAQYTPTWGDAMELALKDANQGLKAAGEERFRFEFVISDTGGNIDVAGDRARAAVAQGAKAVIGADAAEAIRINGVLNYNADPSANLGAPLVCIACPSSKMNVLTVTDADPVAQASERDLDEWSFRTLSSSANQATVIVREVLKKLPNDGDANGDGQVKVGLISTNEATGGAFPKDMRGALKTGYPGGTPILEVSQYDREADPASWDYTPLIKALTDSTNSDPVTPNADDHYPPDFITGYALPAFEAGITRAYSQGGHTVKVFRRSNFRHPTVLQTAAAEAEGMEGISPVLTSSDSSGAYLRRALPAVTGGPPNLFDSVSYDAAMVILLATTKAALPLGNPTEVSGRQVADALRAINVKTGSTLIEAGTAGFQAAVQAFAAGTAIDYQGTSGPVDFSQKSADETTNPDAGGDVAAELVLFRVEKGQFVEGDWFDCVSDSSCPRMPAR
jgi:hypothetical protein